MPREKSGFQAEKLARNNLRTISLPHRLGTASHFTRAEDTPLIREISRAFISAGKVVKVIDPVDQS
jgi:hypothetical protein